ncbi:MAG TPA: efflux RND transporter periplasmic adaptor subunit [Reyranella sp.]|nr:efflux RND transporter periplasmic adaptor subunit [Reyranella sp.]
MTRRARILGLGVLLILVSAVAAGAWSHLAQYRLVKDVADQQRDFVPTVRVATVQAPAGDLVVSLPGTTSAFAAANIFARASGYVDQRNVDIGDKVKTGQLLATIVAPELDHQIAQAEATLAQLRSTLQQRKAARELARVTWDRDKPVVQKGWLPLQQGTIDEQTLRQQEAMVREARNNVVAQEAQVNVLHQQKIYQSVVAPFDGVITQRNIDIGTLVQADATAGTFMFTIMKGNVIRTQVFVPQDEAFGLQPGVPAVVHVPEMPDRSFPGTVTRIADALQPGSRTLLTEIDIPNPDGVLSAGIYCTVELHIPRKVPSLSIPAGAIIFNAGGVQVAVVENGVARLRKIRVARDLGTAVETLDGVKPGDQVILNPSVDLVDGAKVQVAANPSGSAAGAGPYGTK